MSKQQKQNDPQWEMLYYQIGTGTLAVLLVAFGAWGYLAATTSQFTSGMAVRIGATLAVTSLALPQLASLRRWLPTVALGFGLLAIFLIAAKPQYFRVIAGLLAIALTANSALAWLASVAGKK